MGKIKRKIKNLGISQKFMLSLLVFLLVPLLILLFSVNYSVQKSMNRRICETNLEILKQTKSGITNFINDIKLVALNIGTDDDVQNLIRLYNGKASLSEKEKQRVDTTFQVRSNLEARESVRSISIFNSEEIIYQYGDFVLDEDRQFMQRLEQLDGMPLWTQIHTASTTSYGAAYHKIYMMMAIKDMRSYNVIAYQRLTIDEADLREQYQGLLEDDSYIMIVGDGQQILSCSNKKMHGKNWEDLSLGQMPDSEAGYQMNGDSVITWYGIKQTNWTIVKVDSAGTLFRSNLVSSGIIMVCILLTVIFGIIFVILQRKIFITPIVRLSEEAKNFKKQKFVMPSCTDSEDEIGRLNQNLTQMVEYIQDLILNQYENKIKRREIELKYMQSQMNPHFLYNTLDSIRWMAVIEEQTEIAEQIEALSDIFRHALSGGKEVVTVEKEIEHLRNYILIQKNRFGERLHVDIQVEQKVLQCQVLKLILQPLVENAIVHGLESKVEGGAVKVRVVQAADQLAYIIEDDGVGTDEVLINQYLQQEQEEHNVFALKNIEERIKIKYGEKYGLWFHSQKGVGTIVEVHLPVIHAES